MAYRIALRPSAQRQLGKLHGPMSVALHGALLTLADNPRSRGAIELAGAQGLWRVRIHISGASWRVIYRIDDRTQTVLVLRVVPRDEGTYRRLR